MSKGLSLGKQGHITAPGAQGLLVAREGAEIRWDQTSKAFCTEEQLCPAGSKGPLVVLEP